MTKEASDVIEQYYQAQIKAEKDYSPKTVVLIEMGDFYECFESPITKVGKAHELHRIAGLKVAVRSGGHVTHSNPYMAGFKSSEAVFRKYARLILEDGYTIVVMNQFPVPGEKDAYYRKKTRVLSSTINLDFSHTSVSSNVVGLHIEVTRATHYREIDRWELIAGMSCIDITTGRCQYHEAYSLKNNSAHAIHESYRFISANQPREVVLYISGVEEEKCQIFTQKLISELGLTDRKVVVRSTPPPKYLKSAYQAAFLKKVYPDHGVLSIFEYLGLERSDFACLSFVLLLQFCYEHNETILDKIHKPTTPFQSQFMELTYNCAEQLNVIGSGRFTSNTKANLLSILNETKTVLGKRVLTELVLSPYRDPEIIQQSYDRVEKVIYQGKEFMEKLRSGLRGIRDLERLLKRIYVNRFTTSELVNLIRGLLAFRKIYNLYLQVGDEHQLSDEHLKQFRKLSRYLGSRFDRKMMEDCTIERKNERITLEGEEDEGGYFIKPGRNLEVDRLVKELENDWKWLKVKKEELEEMIPIAKKKRVKVPIALTRNDKNYSHACLHTTPGIAKYLQTRLPHLRTGKTTKNRMVLLTDELEEVYTRVRETAQELEKILYQEVMEAREMILNHTECIDAVISYIAHIDITQCFAWLACTRAYHRPEIVPSETAFVEIKDARHAIVEQLSTEEPYVPNDVFLGKEGEPEDEPIVRTRGCLIYGLNTAGKSTYIKMIGLCVIMAQIGCYVPGEMRYYPYHRIITRLSGNDDIGRGKSSFIIEMAEVRAILNSANPNTLILGDELCRGTESDSGISLTVGIISKISKLGSSFAFATHMHDLAGEPEIEKLVRNKTLVIQHLRVRYDRDKDALLYERKLHPGSGQSVYGLEVASYLDIDSDVIEMAYRVRHRRRHPRGTDLVIGGQSRYNSSLYLDECQICSAPATEVHHILEQRKADCFGICDFYNKDRLSNLVVICNKCHIGVHRGLIDIKKTKTSQGVEIQWEHKE